MFQMTASSMFTLTGYGPLSRSMESLVEVCSDYIDSIVIWTDQLGKECSVLGFIASIHTDVKDKYFTHVLIY